MLLIIKGTRNFVAVSRQLFRFSSQELSKYFSSIGLYEDDAKNIDKHQSECVNEKSNGIMAACFRAFYKKPVHFSSLLQISFRLYGIIF
ncbi:hypothetical protein [Bartonella sp. MM73XJBT.G]|uniref:hypothetical protein n=1 Tax=Bartonella sp. MM73XJBT.G TaxID=3019097 RepID=UPI002361853B|nr:hypothetical protein [Bartonella sp. MM73XJBT.G]